VEVEGRFFPLELVSSKHSHRRISTHCQLEKEYKSKISSSSYIFIMDGRIGRILS